MRQPPREREVTVRSADGSPIHAEVYGEEGRPAIVLAHGWTCSLRFWAAQLADLAVDHRVIAYDQRGHGRTPAPSGSAGYSTETLADDLEAVLAATLGPGERAVVAGHSMGGMTIMAAAPRPVFREHAAAVLLCNTASSRLDFHTRIVPMRAGRVRTALTRRIFAAPLPLGPVTPLSKRLLRYGTMGAGAAPERVAECARIVQACPSPVRIGWAHVLGALDLDAEARELTVPTAVMSGGEDRLTPPGQGRSLAAALPDRVSLTVLTGVGHMAPVEAPEAVTAAIRELSATYLATGAEGATA
ncbi:alpha/beta fold hydrolase [Streptomyces corynorhini]|uniref:Alpha/beta fold hydrolase n=1 Tax=Streptomyces corynorhini TaxID=2282652 RepID=A0A370B5V8_9ACTN|nr:alpha/beta fold hydrolase [Streptomyces corynorhini]RDG34775.1 alpha/beta fold hydrolase [Streptomyces corynorhini]